MLRLCAVTRVVRLPSRLVSTPSSLGSKRWVVKGAEMSSSSSSLIQHRPPYLIRTLLVSSSVGLVTPAFIILGVFQAWFRVAPKSEFGRIGKFLIGTAIGGGSLKLVYDYVGPFLWNHSEVVLPFALSNAIASGFWYSVGEMTLGVERMMGMTSVVAPESASGVVELVWGERVFKMLTRLPFAGTAVGVATAITAPVLWPTMIDLCWDTSLKELVLGEREMSKMSLLDSNWLVDAYTHYTLPLAVPVGALAGATMHLALQSYALGKPGVAWTARAVPPLAGVLLASSIYFGYFRTDESDWWWERRVDPVSGTCYSYNYISQVTQDDGGRAADIAAAKRGFFSTVQSIRSTIDKVGELIGFNKKMYNKNEVVYKSKKSKSKKKIEENATSDSNEHRYPFAPRSLEGANPSLQTVTERAVLFELIDRLVRLKRLDLEMQKPRKDRALLDQDDLSQQRKELITEAREAGVAKDLPAVLQACEVGIGARKAATSKSSAEREKAWKRMRDVVYAIDRQVDKAPSAGSISELFRGSKSVTPEYRMALMQKNMSLLEAEFKNKLDYNSESTKTQHWELIAKNVVTSTYFKMSVVAAGGLITALLLPKK